MPAPKNTTLCDLLAKNGLEFNIPLIGVFYKEPKTNFGQLFGAESRYIQVLNFGEEEPKPMKQISGNLNKVTIKLDIHDREYRVVDYT